MNFVIDRKKALIKWCDERLIKTSEEILERERTERRIQREKKIERLFKKDDI